MSDHVHEFANAVNGKVIDTSNMFLRTLVLVHGGAAIALLAFVGGIVGKSSPAPSAGIGNLAMSLVWFGWGVVLAIAAMFLSYCTNYMTVGHAYETDANRMKWLGWGKALVHFLAVITALASLGLFLFAMYQVRDAIIVVLG